MLCFFLYRLRTNRNKKKIIKKRLRVTTRVRRHCCALHVEKPSSESVVRMRRKRTSSLARHFAAHKTAQFSADSYKKTTQERHTFAYDSTTRLNKTTDSARARQTT